MFCRTCEGAKESVPDSRRSGGGDVWQRAAVSSIVALPGGAHVSVTSRRPKAPGLAASGGAALYWECGQPDSRFLDIDTYIAGVGARARQWSVDERY